MLAQLQSTVNEWSNRTHLFVFLNNKPIHVCIRTEEEVAYIRISKEEIRLLADGEDHLIDAEIYGEKEVIVSLLRGEIKLRQATTSNLVELRSSFRTALYLETLLFLVKPYKQINEI